MSSAEDRSNRESAEGDHAARDAVEALAVAEHAINTHVTATIGRGQSGDSSGGGSARPGGAARDRRREIRGDRSRSDGESGLASGPQQLIRGRPRPSFWPFHGSGAFLVRSPYSTQREGSA